MTISHFAHTLPDQPPEQWQLLEDHLRNVAERAGELASSFGAREWGYLAGLWHDLGKYSDAFQRYLRSEGGVDYHVIESDEIPTAVAGKIDHTSAGAQHAVEAAPVLGHLLAYCIAGHHAGLHDAIADGACLNARLKKRVESWELGPDRIRESAIPPLPGFLQDLGRHIGHPEEAPFSISFFVRMLFSCLVDADFLDTEAFMDPERARSRPRWPGDILARMEGGLDRFVRNLETVDRSPVAQRRREVRESCLRAAARAPGLFSLTVPTGGGKTLSSLAFALRHALEHGLDRIVYVIPFTSIIEQNAAVFRKMFEPLVGKNIPDPVLEHHSTIDAGKETIGSRLAVENWDAPLIVTTSVQFYESLFANRTSRCRKLHNLARSVIILDEAQKLPVDFLRPCLLALRELAASYGSTMVLCTATQPAIARRDEFSIGLEGVREIVPDPPALYRVLKRVEVVDLGRQTDEGLADRLSAHEQVLCIVNTRRHAQELFERLGSAGGTFHLSAAMCPEHRSAMLERIRGALERGEPCRVVSTQLVEAGVDVDFPVAYRSLAGLDSIAQAAGRCNRHGRLDRGTTFVFRSEHERSEAFLRDTANATVEILGGEDRKALYDDLLSLEAVEHYFRLYYWSQQDRWDGKKILSDLELVNSRELPFQFAYRSIARRFRLIETHGETVIVPWGERGAALVAELRDAWGLPDRSVLRALQRYTVQVPARQYARHLGSSIELVHDRYPVLVSVEFHYDERLGLVLDREEFGAEAFMT